MKYGTGPIKDDDDQERVSWKVSSFATFFLAVNKHFLQ